MFVIPPHTRAHRGLPFVSLLDRELLGNGGTSSTMPAYRALSYIVTTNLSVQRHHSLFFVSDPYIQHMADLGPTVPRLAISGAIEEPLISVRMSASVDTAHNDDRLYFKITLPRDTVDVFGTGQLTIGELPEKVDNSSITWVPVRMYQLLSASGLQPPTCA